MAFNRNLEQDASKPSFGWKEAIIGGLITLFITVVAGVIIWLITREPDRVERLSYRADYPATFVSHGQSLSFTTFYIKNDGPVRAKNIVIDGVLPMGAKILNKDISFSSGSSNEFKDTSSLSHLHFNLPSLLPADKVTMPILLTGLDGREVRFTAHSDETIAKLDSSLPVVSSAKKVSVIVVIAALLLVAIAQFLINSYLSYRRYAKARKHFRIEPFPQSLYVPTINNSGFLLLHNSLVDEAGKLFQEALNNGSAELMTFANLASVRALQGDQSSADKLISAADWPTTDRHERSVIEVNRFIIAAVRGDVDTARQSILEAIKLSDDVKIYIANSPLLRSKLEELNLREIVAKKVQPQIPAS